MESLFDFAAIRAMIKGGFQMKFDAMHAVTGPYAKEIFERRLGAPEGSVVNFVPLPDFGGHHPDPNLVYAKDLYDLLMSSHAPDFGAASDGDGDRNLILGRGIFITPSDSLAMLAANAHLAPGYKGGIKGIARSMPTSAAADRVAEKLGIGMYGNPDRLEILRQSSRQRQGDDLRRGKLRHRLRPCARKGWFVGRSALAQHSGGARKESVKAIADDHWARFGRNYYTRHDYEAVDSDIATKLVADLRGKLAGLPGTSVNGLRIEKARRLRLS